jgi:hypothetical protein
MAKRKVEKTVGVADAMKEALSFIPLDRGHRRKLRPFDSSQITMVEPGTHLPGGGRPPTCKELDDAARPFVQQHQEWENWGIADLETTTQGILFTRKLFRPTDAYEIAKAIQDAESAKTTVRALGSGFSFSDAALPQNKPLAAALTRFVDTTGIGRELEKGYGFAIDMTSCAKTLQPKLASILDTGERTDRYFFVEAGITLADLNALLDHQNPRAALSTMGGSSGQTLAGAISTGTHGGDFDRAPLVDQVQAIYLIGKGGIHHWIERKRHITDRFKIHIVFPCIEEKNVHYDDDLFNAVAVSLGAMGVIYACVVRVVRQFSLVGWNTYSHWRRFRDEAGARLEHARDGSWSGIKEFIGANFTPTPSHDLKNHFLQVVINPIPHEKTGRFHCFVTNRVTLPLQLVPSGPAPANLSSISADDITDAVMSAQEMHKDFLSAVLSALLGGPLGGALGATDLLQLSALSAGNELIDKALNLVRIAENRGEPWLVRVVIDAILTAALPVPDLFENALAFGHRVSHSILKMTRQHPVPGPQIDLGHKVMTGGVVGDRIPVTSLEVAFPLDEGLLFIDCVLLQFLQKIYPPDRAPVVGGRPRYPAGYVSLRLCGKTDAFLGMQNHDPTAMIEVSLLGNEADVKMLEDVQELALGHRPMFANFSESPPLKPGRLHWGQALGRLKKADVARTYAKSNPDAWKAWKAAQRRLGGTTFTNELMRRCGLA